MRKPAGLCAVALVALTFFFASTPSLQQAGQILYVNNTDAACQGKSPCYSTIQAAVNAALSGYTIQIQPGTYREQLFIEKNTLSSATEADRIIIEADPSVPPGGVIVAGSGGPQCPDNYAIRIKRSNFITLRGLTITGAGSEAIFMMGGTNQSQAIHIERNRIFGNGGSRCNGGITIAQGNPGTVIVNNLIYGNTKNGILFLDNAGGPHHVVNNTILSNTWNGVSISSGHEIVLVNNIIARNGSATGTSGGRFGVTRDGSTSPRREETHLLNNLVCGNRLGEISGPVLDSTDSGNLTPQGSEGPGVSASPGCEVPANVYAALNGPDNLPNTADDDFRLANDSPAIDSGMDPRTLGLNLLFNPIFEADFFTDLARPASGTRGGVPQFDIGAFEFSIANQAPIADAGRAITVRSGTAFNLDGTGSTDPDGDVLTHEWSQTAGPAASLSNPTSATPAVIAPAVTDTTFLVFQLIVSDGLATSTASVNVTVLKPNMSPTLNPIGDKMVSAGNTLMFTVTGSDPDNDPLTFSVAPQPLPANASFNAATGVFAFTPTTSQVGSFNLTFAVSDGQGGTASETITITVAGGVVLNITSPANGATVLSGNLLVRGTVDAGGSEVGVTVNGFPAAVQANSFTALIFVLPDTTSLTATATTAGGISASRTVAMAVVNSPPSPVVLHANPISGLAPLTVSFSLFSDAPVSRVDLDADGDGLIDFSGNQLDQQPFVFTQPGVYVATAMATDDQGNQFASTAIIQVFDQAALDAVLQAKWAAMKEALRTGNISGGISHIVSLARARYEQAFQIIAAQLPNIDQILTNLSLIRMGTYAAIYEAIRIDDGLEMSFEVRFAVDGDGIWRVEAF